MAFIPSLPRQCCHRLACAVLLALGIWAASPAFGQGSDGQGSVETLPSGTYIIAMDNTLQGNFNLRAYGLAVRLLHANIPLKWIINPSKGKDGVDFTATATRIAPSASAAATRNFIAGPLAVHPGYESQALTVINSFGNNVNVYQLTAAAIVTVDSTLVHKPKVAVFDQGGNGYLHTDVLIEAGLSSGTHYDVMANADDIQAGSCYTVATEPHTKSVSGSTNLLNFLLSGGNFFGQCAAVEEYTMDGLLSGFSSKGSLGGTMTFGNFQDPMAQFHGGLSDEGGSVESFKLTTNPGFRIAYSSSDGARYKAYTGRVPGAPVWGGWVHYLAGHNYAGSAILDINGRRMLLNAVLRASGRPSGCNLTIPFDYGDWNGTALVASYVDATRLRLGSTVDTEISMTPNAAATADGADEDGVTMPASVTQGATVAIPVSVFNNTGGTRFLHAWIDFDNDKIFNDALVSAGGERLEAVRSIATSTSARNVDVSFAVPVTASVGTQRGVRFRISDSATTTPLSVPTATGGVGEVEDYVVQIVAGVIRDFGDYNSFSSVSNVANSRLRLGAIVDVESAAVTNDTATGDDTHGSDDEDGAVVPETIFLGQNTSISVTRTNTIGVTSYLNGWLDFNRNGGLTEANEKVINNVSVANGTSNSTVNYTFTVPADAGLGLAGIRLRLARSIGLGPTGDDASNGEVEDYRVTIACPTITLSPTSFANGTVGTAYSQTVTANGVATTWTYSRSGGTLPGGLTLNSSTGVLSGTPTSAGSFSFTIAATGANGCSASQAYTVVVSNPPTDFGDYSGFTDASSIVVSTLKIGAITDDETAAVTNPFATGDDTSGSDDEDGVTLPASLHQGTASSMTVNVTNTSGSTAFLNVWIDFNRNGVLTDVGEQVAVNTTISNGTSNSNRTINFTVPAGAFQGNTAARVRLTSTSSPGSTGASGNGEVEDHLVRTCPLMVVCPAVSILPVGTVGSAYSLAVSALGGSGGFVFAVSSGSAPAGLTLNASTGLLSGTPTTVQTRTFAVTATDSFGCTVSRNYTMSIVGAGSTIQVYGEAGTNNVPITAASYVVNGATRIQSSDQSGSTVAVNTNSAINLSTLTLNDNGESKTLNVVNLNGGSVSNVTIPASNGVFGVLLNGTATSIASSGVTAFQNSAAQISTNNNLNHYIFDDRGEGEPDGTGEYDIRFNYAFTTEDYVVCQERFGNSHIQLQALDATGNIIPGSRTVQVRGTHDWNTGYASASYISDQPYFLTVIRHGIFGTPSPIFGFRLSIQGADCKFFGMSDNPFTDNPTNAGVIGDRVWNDINRNGIQDSGESGVNGVTVRLLSAATSATVATTTTNSSGIYSFTAVAPGDYRVEFVAPFNHAFTSKDLGGDDRLDSDADTSTGRSDIFTMLPCDSISYIDAGVFVLPTTDFGDYSAFGSASSTVASGLRIGALLDTESVAVTSITANGDDTTGSDDEDGVTIPATLVMGDPASITVNVTNTSGASAHLNAWIDYDRNGVLTDAGEQIATNTLVANGTSGSSRVINFTVPEITPTGAVALRVRLTSTSNPGSTGQSGNGEVEDHMVTLACPLITISPTTPAQATAGLNYSQTLTQSGGHGTITWSVPGGGLPAGLTLDSGTGVLSGIATTEGSYPFTVWASDGAGCSGSRAMTLVVGTMLDRGDYAGFGGATQTANTTLRIGTAATDVDVSALTNAAATSDDANGTDDEDLTMPSLVIGNTTTLNVPVTATPASLSGGTARLNVFVDWNGDGDASDAGETQAVQTVTASGTFTFSLTPPAGTTPGTKYLRLRVTEGITAPAFIGNSTLKGEVEDYAITVGCQAMTVGPVSLATATLGTAYTQTFTQSGANGTVTWSLASGSLPAGLTLDTTRGILSGTATVALATSFTIMATDAAGCTATRGYTLIPVCAAVSITPESLVRGTTGVSYSQALSAAPSATYSWQVVAGTLPAGLSLNSKNGVLSGLPTATGDHTFTVKASTGATSTPELEFTIYNLDLNPGDTFNIRDYVRPKDGTTQPIDWSAVRFTYTEAGANDPTSPANWNLAAFNAGQFVTVTSADAVAGGNSGAGSFRIYLVRDGQVDFDDHMEIRVDASRQSVVNSAKASPLIAYACSGTREYTLQVCPALVLSPTTLFSAMVGNAYSQPLSTSGSAGPFVYEITAGSLPAGLALNTGSGLISGTPTSTTSASFTISSTNSAGCSISRAYSLAPLPNTDFGDFSTFGSASSTFNNGLKIGALLDTEVSVTTNTAATGDDITGSDDEDGVTMPASITAGSTVTIPVVVTNTTGSAASLNAWIDFNNNGSLTDAGEQIAVNLSIAAGSTNVTQNITVTVPTGASVGAGRGARFRLTSTASPGATGASGQGEVEDYVVTIAAPTLDFGDFHLFPSATSTANTRLRLGGAVDAEGAATTNTAATGDDLTGTDDEDGVTVPATITQGTATSLTVNLTNTIGATAFLNAWIDFNGNGVLTDAGEQIATNTSIANSTSNSNRTVSFTVPAVIRTGAVGVRVRITNVSTPGPDGQDGSGEVEDYITSITANTDFGDHSLFSSASSLTNPTLRIGALVDSDGGLDLNADATADDLNGSDDEDGVTLLAELPQGSVGSITVNTTNTSGSSAFLNAWIDFNRNGVLTDAGEQIVTNTSITTGTSNINSVLSFNVPVAATLGRVGVRVRLSSVSSPGPDGLDGNGEVEDHTTPIVPATTDFGDALNLADASSTANTNLRLGALVDLEGAPTKTANADGDDNTGSDDEDGLSFPSVTAGQPVALPVSVSNLSGAAGYLNAWIDYNNNGVLTDAGEQVATNVLVATGTTNGTQVLNFNIPTNAVTAATSLATRFRITNIQNPSPTGHAGTGEVEDHPIIILAPLTDFGDHSDYADVSNTASTNLRLGALVDTEYASTRNVTATGDDVTGNDDEDAVTIPTMTAGAPATIPVTVTNNTGASAFLNAWIDYNDNGVFGDPGEQITTNSPIANLSTNAVSNLNITVPATATTAASLGVRVRLTALNSPGATGAGGLGEVEDYAVSIAAPTTDFGDFTSFGSASSTVVPTVKLGVLIDTEFVQTANATATGDDTTASDDEDAVTFPSMTAGAPATIPVLVTNTSGAGAFLNAWIDYNNNGTLEAGEQIATNVSIATASNNITQNLSITVPTGALTGVSLGARFRLTSTSGAAATGLVGNGEVEDHIVTISAPTTDFGDHGSFADASQGANPFLRLGALIDTEFASTRNATATGDDITGSDDEDGVVVPAMIAGQTVTIPVTISNGTGANGFLNAWIDFNNNGVLTDSGEQVASNILIATGAVNAVTNLSVTVPPTAATGVSLGLRFRLSAPSGLGPTGVNGLAGEIEDYAVTIAAPTTDFGDHSNLADASSTQSATIRLGALTDSEFLSTRNATAAGDDTTGVDDEDGVTIPAMTAGAPATIPVLVTNTSGAAVNLNAWIDYNNNGTLEAGEQIASNVNIANGSNNITQNIAITVPATATSGVNLPVRVRLTSTSSPGPTGASGNGEVEDYIVNIANPTTDFGDFASFGSSSNAANNSLRLGALIDAEFVATTNATATGDDITGSDDEDGVTLPTIIAGQTVTVPVVVTNTTGAGAFLNAWIDFNNDGDVLDAGEQVITNAAVANGSNHATLIPSVTAPATALTGVSVGARFRLTTTASPAAIGAMGTFGEVEDYMISIAAPTTDLGDFASFSDATSTVVSTIKLGALTDVEFLSTRDTTATGDDITGSDDEDAVTFPALMAGAPATIPVLVSNTSGAPAFLNAWIDYNNNGTLEAGEQIASNVSISTGSNNITQNLSITVPANALTVTNVGVRFRLTSTATPGATGVSGNGEVEDYVVSIANPPLDYGDSSVLGSASSTANASLRLGTAATDTEFVPTLNATASGDDNTGSDDEDGVSIPTLTAGAPDTITVTATNATGAAAFLNAWIDFNNDGDVLDAGEQLATNTNVATGTTNGSIPLNFTVPANAVTGANISLRFRLTSTSTPGITGTSGNGEVEDHVTTIAVPITDFGDWNGAADASSVASSNLRMGSIADTEFVSTRNATAAGDDITGSDDEDGVTLAASYNLSAASSATVVTTNLSGAAAYLNAWIDYNNNGSFADVGEQIATNTLIANGTNGVAQTLNFTVPAAAIPGQRGMRVRFTNILNPTPIGAAGTGEVEDNLITINCPTITLSPTSVTNGTVGAVYSQNITSVGGTGPYGYVVSAGDLPSGITLSPSGVLSGTLTSNAVANFTIRATDANGCTGIRAYTFTPVCLPISITPSTATQGLINTPYTQTLTASGGTAPYSAWTITAGSLPNGLTLNAATGIISGTPLSSPALATASPCAPRTLMAARVRR
jgi:GH25 family lysozyme M1 (1,4-beta-N-acetylmuramidase)